MAGIDQVDSRIWQAAEVAHIRLYPVVGAAVAMDEVDEYRQVDFEMKLPPLALDGHDGPTQ